MTNTPKPVTVGDDGTVAAVAGFGGTAVAGYEGTAVAGDFGKATAGDYGLAITGDYGCSVVTGDHGIAAAGRYGTAAAGNYGVIIIGWRDGEGRRATRGRIGADWLLANMPYRLDAQGHFVAQAP